MQLTNHFYRILCTKDSISSHQRIGSRLNQTGPCFQVHATVYFNQGFRTCPFNQGTQFTNFFYRMFDKLLPAKSRIHAHDAVFWLGSPKHSTMSISL